LPHLGHNDRIRILQLSDLHASWEVPLDFIDAAIELGLKQKPDVICITGDFITRDDLTFDGVQYLRVLKKLVGAVPVYAILGNHDGGDWAAQHMGYHDASLVRGLVSGMGAKLLHNQREIVTVRGRQFVLAGLGDIWSNEVEPEGALGGLEQAEAPVVLMAHNPDTKDLLGARYRWDLMLSGHTHGGQMRVPLIGTPFAPVQDMRYVEGLKHWGSRQIQVTRGVGNLVGMRIHCRPQVSVIDLSGVRT
jgi:uncharacterized protein